MQVLLKYCLMFNVIYDLYVLLVKQGEKTQASRSQLVYYMRNLQRIFDQADNDHRMSSHILQIVHCEVPAR